MISPTDAVVLSTVAITPEPVIGEGCVDGCVDGSVDGITTLPFIEGACCTWYPDNCVPDQSNNIVPSTAFVKLAAFCKTIAVAVVFNTLK